jgi:hypothetical protein
MYTATKGSKGKVTWKRNSTRSGPVRKERRAKPVVDDEEYGAQTVESDEFYITPEDAEEAGHGPFVEYKSALGPNGSFTAVYGLESIDGKGVHQHIGYNIFKKDVTKVPRGMKLVTMIRNPSSLHRNWFGDLPVSERPIYT